MRAQVYASRKNARIADRFAEQLKETGEYTAGVARGNAAFYRGEIHRGEVVFHDGTVQRIPMVCEDAGVPCERFSVEGDREETSAGTVGRDGPWWKAYDAAGAQIGKAKRTREEAEALLPATGDE